VNKNFIRCANIYIFNILAENLGDEKISDSGIDIYGFFHVVGNIDHTKNNIKRIGIKLDTNCTLFYSLFFSAAVYKNKSL
jgi:hypothetical protein